MRGRVHETDLPSELLHAVTEGFSCLNICDHNAAQAFKLYFINRFGNFERKQLFITLPSEL